MLLTEKENVFKVRLVFESVVIFWVLFWNPHFHDFATSLVVEMQKREEETKLTSSACLQDLLILLLHIFSSKQVGLVVCNSCSIISSKIFGGSLSECWAKVVELSSSSQFGYILISDAPFCLIGLLDKTFCEAFCANCTSGCKHIL